MSFRKLAGGGNACAYCGFCLVMAGPRECCPAGRDYDALAAENAALRKDAECYHSLAGLIRANRTALAGEVLDWFTGESHDK